MRNLETLYREDGAFRVDAIKHAADYIGTTSVEFAEQWLAYEPEPAEDVNGTADGARTAPDAKSDASPVDSRTQLIADIQAWLESNVGFSVWLTDLMEQVHGWLDRQAAITERECRDYEDALREQHHKRRFELKGQVDRLTAERDALADDLKECMEERDYWKQEVQFCMDAAYPPSHAPERPYDPRVMAYPDREGCTTPSTLVSAMIDGLRDDVRDTVMPIVEESANAKADCERWREACGSMMDVAHEIERIMAEMELR